VAIATAMQGNQPQPMEPSSNRRLQTRADQPGPALQLAPCPHTIRSRARWPMPRVPSSGVRAIKLIELARPRSAAAAGCDCDCRQTVLYCTCVSTYVQLASYSSAPKGACGGPSCARDCIHAAYRPEHCSSAASPVIHESAGHRALTTPPRAGPAGSRTIVVGAHLASHGSIGPAVNVLGLHKREGMGAGR
jgi:hypothetical protein